MARIAPQELTAQAEPPVVPELPVVPEQGLAADVPGRAAGYNCVPVRGRLAAASLRDAAAARVFESVVAPAVAACVAPVAAEAVQIAEAVPARSAEVSHDSVAAR